MILVSGSDGVEDKLLPSVSLSLFATLPWRLDHRMCLDFICPGECVKFLELIPGKLNTNYTFSSESFGPGYDVTSCDTKYFSTYYFINYYNLFITRV